MCRFTCLCMFFHVVLCAAPWIYMNLHVSVCRAGLRYKRSKWRLKALSHEEPTYDSKIQFLSSCFCYNWTDTQSWRQNLLLNPQKVGNWADKRKSGGLQHSVNTGLSSKCRSLKIFVLTVCQSLPLLLHISPSYQVCTYSKYYFEIIKHIF